MDKGINLLDVKQAKSNLVSSETKLPTAKVLRWYELNSEAWCELRLESGRLYFNALHSEPEQYVCRDILSVNDVPMAWLQIYGEDMSITIIHQAYQAYRRSLRSGNNQGVEL